MILLDGNATSQKILNSLKEEIDKLKIKPVLDIILVGDDPASIKYVELKNQKAEAVGIGGQIYHLSADSTTQDVIDQIQKLNHTQNTTGLMVQLPLPSQINTQQVLMAIDPQKDADGLSPTNLGLLFQKESTGIASATALGIIKLLQDYQIDLDGKNAVIIGRSPEVSLPLFALLMSQNCTVTICHSHTKDLKNVCQNADILISAIGQPRFFGREFIKKDSVLVDVGFATDPITGKVSGDFDFENVQDIAKFITPVPGGVGPMTIASLLFNTVDISLK
ncbi:MAG: bifunctional 5,10-methylenetetrahydrofolate dehydrogenase/5,10-methenyltetrahydrofolate cyclohydrolase [Candidatus Shapirobacteria bacterium]|nr:bifunctional 5,10-methylenetetrahydrofolate dehydrogenase/5,10-methenyltetrahydrofolate cyclohydrolase [Candidatus Shapirobacteria bacterium]